jgi:hydrogenase nickel incorporation protein HypB
VRTLRLEHDLLAKNQRAAEQNRGFFAGRRCLSLNFVSSPGAGKTTLLERTIRELGGRHRFAVIQGDQATDRDAERVRRAGAPAVQLITGTVCHLDAPMVARAVTELELEAGTILAIENVGNLVCPALFDLGEHSRIVVASVPEGSDKPLKYPYMFRSAELVLLNKLDLLPYVDFDLDAFTRYVHSVNPKATLISLSATTGEGLGAWFTWLERKWDDRCTSVRRGAVLEGRSA